MVAPFIIGGGARDLIRLDNVTGTIIELSNLRSHLTPGSID